jgi:hypothetical protein
MVFRVGTTKPIRFCLDLVFLPQEHAMKWFGLDEYKPNRKRKRVEILETLTQEKRHPKTHLGSP